MRLVILSCLFILAGYSLQAQLSLVPQLGFENTHTNVEMNESSSFSPSGSMLSPQAALRMNYLFKRAHGPYISVATSRSILNLKFTNPETAMNDYIASRAGTQLRLEGGYQLSTKPIYFKKNARNIAPAKNTGSHSSLKSHCNKLLAKSSCHGKSLEAPVKSSKKGAWVRLQPSIGVAYLPTGVPKQITSTSQGNQKSYQYNAGNFNAALVSGVGFDFGKGRTSKFNVSLNYVKSLSDNEQSVTTVQGNKTTVTNFASQSSMWSVRMGFPINLNKQKTAVKKLPQIQKSYEQEKKCGQRLYEYRYRCIKKA